MTTNKTLDAMQDVQPGQCVHCGERPSGEPIILRTTGRKPAPGTAARHYRAVAQTEGADSYCALCGARYLNDGTNWA